MRDPQLEQDFPKLTGGGYSIQSPEDSAYNCVAFAVGNLTQTWQWMPYRTGGYYWPPGIEGDGSIQDWIKVFTIHGYRVCNDGTFEKGLEKVALYVDAEGVPTHVAKQDITTGKWMSKLGKTGHDIDHISLEVLAGFERDEYGRVAQYMSRRREWPRQSLWFRLRAYLARVISP